MALRQLVDAQGGLLLEALPGRCRVLGQELGHLVGGKRRQGLRLLMLSTT